MSPGSSQALGLKPFVLGRSRTRGLSRLCCPGETSCSGQPRRRRVISQRLGFMGSSGGAGGHTEHPPRLRGWGWRLRAPRQLSGSSIWLLVALELLGIRASQPHAWLGNLPCERRCWKKSRHSCLKCQKLRNAAEALGVAAFLRGASAFSELRRAGACPVLREAQRQPWSGPSSCS